MIRALCIRSFRDGLSMLVSCSALVAFLVWFRLWIVSQIDFGAVLKMFASGAMPKFIEQLMPVPLETLASIEGRVAYGYEEAPAVGLTALWAIARGTDCIAGRLGRGTMEMMLSQPISRLTLVSTHTAVTVFGAAVLAGAAWLGTAAGIAMFEFDEPTAATAYLPASVNLFALGVILIGVSTLGSAAAGSRGQAVGLVVGFYFAQITCKVLSMVGPKVAWLKQLTFLTAYEPTKISVGLAREPEVYQTLAWEYNALLLGIGLVCWIVATAMFCRRDLPAPV